ncbi:MAG: hypothetical protein E6J63_05610 [Deltaproteobacteria bacterium]|nr:MAG: hypothetical protein E6J63_05610 [Deltaproteobacteria bacterium]
MQPRVAGTTLLVTLFLAARASGEEAESRPPVRPGAMIGLVSLPRPIDAEVFVRIVDIFGVGLGYSDFPAFIANPLLELVGAKSDSTDARLDQFNAFDLDLHVFPFRGRFFVGSSFGRQSLKGAVTENTALGPQTATVDLTTWYATPRVGWIWTFEHGFFLGFDLGVQFKLGADKTVTVPPSATPDIRNRVDNLADLGSSYPLPSLHLRLGWMP